MHTPQQQLYVMPMGRLFEQVHGDSGNYLSPNKWRLAMVQGMVEQGATVAILADSPQAAWVSGQLVVAGLLDQRANVAEWGSHISLSVDPTPAIDA
jgi:hypothetical protein